MRQTTIEHANKFKVGSGIRQEIPEFAHVIYRNWFKKIGASQNKNRYKWMISKSRAIRWQHFIYWRNPGTANINIASTQLEIPKYQK